MNTLREIAFRIDPVLWVREILGITPTNGRSHFCGRNVVPPLLVLTSRQFGKTTAAAICLAHSIFEPGSLSVVACPTQQQSAEAIRKVRRWY